MHRLNEFSLRHWSLPARLWATAVILMLGLGLAVAMIQATVHDVLPTMQRMGYSSAPTDMHTGGHDRMEHPRGDLFGDSPIPSGPPPKAWYRSDNFIFALKFTHIHVFGMSGIFIVMGALAVFLERPKRQRCWMIVMPFGGILIDLLSVWLKLFVHPAFFWLHIPGGLFFGVVFAVESWMMLKELWGSSPALPHHAMEESPSSH